MFLLSTNVYSFSLSDFEVVRKTFLSIYGPIVKDQSGLNLIIDLDGETKNYFGGMSTDESNMYVHMGSEFDREIGVTPDFYVFILCHEVGHLLGGLPKKITRGKGAQFSSEGQSDYYAASVCMKKIFQENIPIYTPQIVTKKVEELCRETDDFAICIRIANAGREFFEYLKVMYSEYGSVFITPDMDTPEAAGLSATYEYPSFQCRLDTLIAGATNQARPSCWYRPAP